MTEDQKTKLLAGLVAQAQELVNQVKEDTKTPGEAIVVMYVANSLLEKQFRKFFPDKVGALEGTKKALDTIINSIEKEDEGDDE